MAKLIDLTGQQFGYLTVLNRGKENKNGRPTWDCKCKCGNIVNVRGNDLRNGRTLSCGCLGKQRLKEANEKRNKVHIGDKFGKLTVIEDLGYRYFGNEKHRRKVVLCQCECGNKIEIRTHELMSKGRFSCGCDIPMSQGENKVYQLLVDNDLDVECQKTFDTCRFSSGRCARFDFFVDNTYIIEYNGAQHYIDSEFMDSKAQKERDKIKIQWCKDNNIPIIVIPYTHFKDLKIEDLLLETTKFRVE